VASLFFVMPALSTAGSRLAAWKAVFIASGVGSVFLIGDFMGRLLHYQRELSVGGAVSLYLRTGGLLNHWMVFATVEILVIAGLIAFWSHYPGERRRWWPILLLNFAAVALSLTRTAWITCFALVALELVWRRSKWTWLIPVLPLGFYILAPGPVRSRIRESMKPDYYSNQERLQMLRVGWRLIRERPLTGVGAGRIREVYRSHIGPGEPVPAYYGHLHNNVVQMAATQGIPVALAAILVAASFLVALVRAGRNACSRDAQFVTHAGILALIGFSIAGLFEYTYGHSLGLILLSFALISPVLPYGPAPEAQGP
jgi:O-antigen ligase